VKIRRKLIHILVTLSFLLTLMVPFAAPALAATDNYAISIPKVQNDKDDVTLGTLVIREDEDSDGRFAVNDVITINLPTGVEYSEKPTGLNEYVATDDPALTLAFVAGAESYISFKVTGIDGDVDENKIYVYFGALWDDDANPLTDEVPRASTVDIDGDVTGDIKVEIDASGTAITSEYKTVARVVEGNTTTTISSVETLPIDGAGDIGTIKITENAAGVLEASNDDFIELVLPNDYEWVVAAGDITAAGVDAEYVDGINDDTLRIRVLAPSAGQAGFISVSGVQVRTPDDADEGEIEVTVKGNEVTKKDIVIAKVGDFGFELSVDGDVETIVAGRNDEEIPTIVIDDKVDGSWIVGRTVKLTLPSWAEWENFVDDAPLGASNVNADKDELKYTVQANAGKAELEDMSVNIDADAPEGDLVVKISGSTGVEGELVIAKIVAPFKVTATKPEITIGTQNQELGEITLTETEDGAIEEGYWVVFKAPSGMTFSDTPDVEVTEGDIDIDDEDTDDEFFAFRVTGESGKKASTIKITNVTFDVDRTIPVGDVTFKVYMVNENFDDEGDIDIDDVNDISRNDDELEEVTKVAVGTVITPAPVDVTKEATFVIGQSTYKLNGVDITMDVAPYIKDGRTFMPIRYVAQSLGVADNNILWNDTEKSVVIIKSGIFVKLVIGSNVMTVNGTSITMDVAPETVDPGRTMLPLRFVAQALGADVQWDEATQTVTIK